MTCRSQGDQARPERRASGPTLRVRPGDTLRIDMVNRLEQPTNLHVHGLHVSLEDDGDNVFVVINPGDSFSYEY